MTTQLQTETKSRSRDSPDDAEQLAADLFDRLSRRKAHADLTLLSLRGQRFANLAVAVREQLVGSGRLLRETKGDLGRLNTEICELLSGVQGPFRLFVVGSGNTGKSSTVNALLGATVAKVEACACTWRIDVFAPPGAGSHLLDLHGEKLIAPLQDLRTTVFKDETAREESEARVQALFRQRRRTVDRTAWKELKEQLRRDALYCSPWIEAQWGVAEHAALEGIWLVDTPGLHQEDPLGGEGSERRAVVDARAREYYQKADGVLWILDGTVLAGAGAREAVEQVRAALDELGGGPDNVIAVINRLDLLDPRQGDDIRARVIDDAHTRFGDFFQEIVGFSALHALPDASPEERLESGLDQLTRAIDRRFRRRAAETRRRAKTMGLRHLESAFLSRLATYAERLETDAAEFDARIERIHSDAKAVRKAQNKDVNSWRKSHYDRICGAINARLEEAYHIAAPEQRVQFVRREIFDLERIRVEHAALVGRLRRETERMVERREEEASFSEFRHLRVKANALSRDFEAVLPDEEAVDFSVFTSGFNLLLGEAAEWGWVRTLAAWMSSGKKNELSNQANQLLHRLAGESKARARADVDEAKSRLVRRLTSTFASVHLERDSVPIVAQELSKLRALHDTHYERAGAAGLVAGSADQLSATSGSVLERLERPRGAG